MRKRCERYLFILTEENSETAIGGILFELIGTRRSGNPRIYSLFRCASSRELLQFSGTVISKFVLRKEKKKNFDPIPGLIGHWSQALTFSGK
jgi:hypothetical protein